MAAVPEEPGSGTNGKIRENLYKPKQPKGKKISQPRQKKQKAQHLLQLSSEAEQQEEGLYKLVKQDSLLRAKHAAKLRSTPGYGHLSEEEAGNMAEQMLRLVTLTFELLKDEQDQPCQENYYIGMAA